MKFINLKFLRTKFLNLSLLMLISLVAFSQQDAPVIPKEPLEVVKGFLAAYQQGDHETFTSYLHPNVVWVQPGSNKLSGIKASKSELLLMGKQMWELTAGTIQLADVQYYAPNGNTVVAVLHWKATNTSGDTLDIRNIDGYTVEDGKIITGRIYTEDASVEDKFWGK